MSKTNKKQQQPCFNQPTEHSIDLALHFYNNVGLTMDIF